MAIIIERIEYKGWQNCYRVSNGDVDLILTGDVGPRIIRFGFVGGQNLFKEFEEQMGTSGEPSWVPRGGHRLWIAPEDPVKSYAPDNGPLEVRIGGDVVEATEPVEALTGIEKKITVRMWENGDVQVRHTLRNAGSQPCDLAVWAPTMMAQGGHGIHGFPSRGTHPEMLLPVNPLVMWAFTDLSDPRWRLLRKYLVLRQDPSNAVPQKLGSYHESTWGAYFLNGELFVKRYRAIAPASEYPDLGCTFETFTNRDFLELETLGPLTRLAPRASVDHIERWSLHRGVHIDNWSDESLDRALGSVIG
jgi:hypothetical protein